jgi:hypothetical protein
VRFPLAFAARVSLSTALMATIVGGARLLLPSPLSWGVVGALTACGAVLAVLGMRWFKVLGPRELDLLSRANLPGRAYWLRWLARPAAG